MHRVSRFAVLTVALFTPALFEARARAAPLLPEKTIPGGRILEDDQRPGSRYLFCTRFERGEDFQALLGPDGLLLRVSVACAWKKTEESARGVCGKEVNFVRLPAVTATGALHDPASGRTLVLPAFTVSPDQLEATVSVKDRTAAQAWFKELSRADTRMALRLELRYRAGTPETRLELHVNRAGLVENLSRELGVLGATLTREQVRALAVGLLRSESVRATIDGRPLALDKTGDWVFQLAVQRVIDWLLQELFEERPAPRSRTEESPPALFSWTSRRLKQLEQTRATVEGRYSTTLERCVEVEVPIQSLKLPEQSGVLLDLGGAGKQ